MSSLRTTHIIQYRIINNKITELLYDKKRNKNTCKKLGYFSICHSSKMSARSASVAFSPAASLLFKSSSALPAKLASSSNRMAARNSSSIIYLEPGVRSIQYVDIKTAGNYYITLEYVCEVVVVPSSSFVTTAQREHTHRNE